MAGIWTESENRILTFEMLFWHSNWVGKCYSIFKILFWNSTYVGKCYFDIRNPILTFELSRKMLFWHSKSYFDNRTESENRILTFKILFWHSNWVRKSYFDIQNAILTFNLSRKSYFLWGGVYYFYVVRTPIRPSVCASARDTFFFYYIENVVMDIH